MKTCTISAIEAAALAGRPITGSAWFGAGAQGDSPPNGGVAPSAVGPAWCYLHCPFCQQRIRSPFARITGVVIHTHRYSGRHDVCRLLVLVDGHLDFHIQAIVDDGDVDRAMQLAIERGLKTVLNKEG